MGRPHDDDPVKPCNLSEAEREALKRQFRGVFWDRKTKRWRCQLGYQSKKIFLGYFDDAGEAARAYDQKLVELRGAGARTNFPITEYLDMMPTPTKRGGGTGAAAVAAAAAAAAAARDEGQHNMEDEEEDDGEEIDQPAPSSGRHGSAGAAAAAGGAETPSLDPGYASSQGAVAGQRMGGLLDLPNGSAAGAAGYAVGGGSGSPRHGLSHLPAIAPLSTDLPGEQQLALQDYNMASEDDLTAAAQRAVDFRRSFDGCSIKWQQQQQQHYGSGMPHQQLAAATSTGSAGGSAAAAAAAGYGGRSSEFELHQRAQQQQQHLGTFGDDTAAAAAAGYGGNASLYGSYGHHHHAAAVHHQQQQQAHFAPHHSGHLRNGSTPGDLYGASHGWADAAAAAAAGGGYDGHAAYAAHGYPHHHSAHHHSHSGVVGGAHGAFSDSGGYAGGSAHGGYPMHPQHHAAAAAAAAAGYGHHAHHAHYQQQQQQHARHYQHALYQQQQQQAGAAGFFPGEGEDQHMAAAAGHMQHAQQQHYHAHQQQQQQHGHFPLHHSHSYPGATGHDVGMEGAAAAAAGYYPPGSTGVYTSHAQAVAAAAARAAAQAQGNGQFPPQHPAGQYQQHHQQHFGASGPDSRGAGGMVAAQGVYGSSGDLQQQHYGGGLAAAQQQQQPGQQQQQQQQYDARAAASNPAVAAAEYRQRLVTYGLHGYASDAGEYGGVAAMEGDRGYAATQLQHYQQQEQQQQQQMQADADLAGATAMDATGGSDCYPPDRFASQQAAFEPEDPWIQARGLGRDSTPGTDGTAAAAAAAAAAADVAAGGEGLAPVRTTLRTSGRTSRAASRAAAGGESDDYDIDDDDEYGSDSDTGRGRGRNSRRRSRAAAAAAAQNGSDGVLRTKQRTGDTGDDERAHSYRGVFWDKKSRRWRCQLGHKNKKIFLGYFGVAEDAARAYDQKLVELHGGSAKTNFPIHNYLGGSRDASAAAAAAVAESPQAPGAGGADVPGGRRRSSHAGDASAKASQVAASELSWGALGLPRSARLSHDASEGAPRLSWAGVDTLSSWDQQDPDSQYAKRRRLMQGGGQLPTSPQEYGALTSGLHGSHQAVGGEDLMQPAASAMGRQGSGYRVVETPSVLTASLTGRHSSGGGGGGSAAGLHAPAPSFDAAAAAAGILPPPQQQQQQAALAAGRNSLALARMASGEVGAVQALSGLHALGGRSNSGPPGVPGASGAHTGLERSGSGLHQSMLPLGSSSATAIAVLAAAGASAAAMAAAQPVGGVLGMQQQQQQSQASRLFEEAVHQYGGKVGGCAAGLPAGHSGLSVAAPGSGGRVSDPNTGASSSTATPPSAITAGGHFGASPQNTAQAALSRLNSSEVRAVQALSGIHNDCGLPYQAGRGGAGCASADGGGGAGGWGGFGAHHQQQQQQGFHLGGSGVAACVQQQQQPSPASITETVAKELICRAPAVSAVASSSIAAVAAAAAAAAAAKGCEQASSAAARSSADGSFSDLIGEMAAGLGDSRARAATPPDALTAGRLSTPGLSPLLANSLLPLPPPLQLQLDGVQDLGDSSLPGTASAAAAAAAAAVGIKGPAGAEAAAAAAKRLSHLDPGDAFAAEAGWGGQVEDLLVPRKRPSCSGNSGLMGLLGNIGQVHHEADAAAAAVAVPQQQAGTVAAAEAQAQAPAGEQQQEGAASLAAPAAAMETASPAAAAVKQEVQGPPPSAAVAPKVEPAVAAAAAVAHAAAPLQPAVVQVSAMPAAASLASAPASFFGPTVELMAVLP